MSTATTRRPGWPTDASTEHVPAMETLLRDPGLVAGGRIRAEAWHHVCQASLRAVAPLTAGERDMLGAIVRASDGQTLAHARALLRDALSGALCQDSLPPHPDTPRMAGSKASRSPSKPRSPAKRLTAGAKRKKAAASRKTASTAAMPDPYMVEGDEAGLKLSYDNTSATLFGLPLMVVNRSEHRRTKSWRVKVKWLLMEDDKNIDVFYIPKHYTGPRYRAVLYAAIKQLIICYLTPPDGDPLHPADSQVPG